MLLFGDNLSFFFLCIVLNNLEKHTQIEHLKHTQQQLIQHQTSLTVIKQKQPEIKKNKVITSPNPSSTLPPNNMSPKSLSRFAPKFNPSSPHQFGVQRFPSYQQQQPYPLNGLPITPHINGSHSYHQISHPPHVQHHQHRHNQHGSPLMYPSQQHIQHIIGNNQVPMVPAPQLTQRLSVNSLPVPTSNHNNINSKNVVPPKQK